VSVQVRIATQNEIAFLATGGGHGTTITLGGLEQGIEIDMSNLNQVDIDTENNLITVGGGTRFENVVPALYAAGREMRKSFIVDDRATWRTWTYS
jgi:fumiquinazoline A oxidase